MMFSTALAILVAIALTGTLVRSVSKFRADSKIDRTIMMVNDYANKTYTTWNAIGDFSLVRTGRLIQTGIVDPSHINPTDANRMISPYNSRFRVEAAAVACPSCGALFPSDSFIIQVYRVSPEQCVPMVMNWVHHKQTAVYIGNADAQNIHEVIPAKQNLSAAAASCNAYGDTLGIAYVFD